MVLPTCSVLTLKNLFNLSLSQNQNLAYEIKAEFVYMEKPSQLSFWINLLLTVLEVIYLHFP